MRCNFVPLFAPGRDAAGMLNIVVSSGLCTATRIAGKGLPDTVAEESVNF